MFGLRGRQILILSTIVVLIFTATQYFPAYFAAFQFNDYIRQQVKYAASARKTTDTLRDEVLRKATDLGIPLTKEDIRVTKKGPSFTLEVDYRWPIDMKVYRHVLAFHTSQTGELFENASD